MAIIGYARVSTADQDLRLQREALQRAGVERVYEEVASGARVDRPKLADAMSYMRRGDCLVVWRLDRLARSIRQLIDTMTSLEARGIELRSLTENIDTSTAGGRLIFHMFAALSEFERDLIRERTNAGLAVARARGRKGGAKAKLTPRQVDQIRRILSDPKSNVKETAKLYGVSRATIYRYMSDTERAA